MDLPGGVWVEEVEGGDGAGVACPVLEAALHVVVAVQLGDLEGPGPAEGDGGVQIDAELGRVPGLEVQLEVLAGVVPAEGGDRRVAGPEDLEVVSRASPSCTES